MAKDYGDTSIKTLDPVTHIRMRPGMYVGEPGTGAMYHDCIYILMKDLFKNKRLSLICALAFFATPRIFAQMHFNNKDIVLLALMADTCCLGVLATKYCRPAQVIGFSLLAAIAANTKVVTKGMLSE